MNIGILGTGMVGQTLAAKFVALGHGVMIGTRNVAETCARTTPDMMGNPPFSEWHRQNAQVKLGDLSQAAAFGALVFNCTSGAGSLAALHAAGAENLAGKILVDVANPLDFSKGMPPSLFVCNTDSLGEQIQRAFPRVKVVKTLNTMNAHVMVNPGLVSGEHAVFVNGNDADAKTKVIHLLKQMGWQAPIDLGDITSARAVEMLLPIWIQLMGVLKTPMFNFQIAK